MTLDELRDSGAVVITLTDAAELLSVDRRTAARAAADGQLPCVRIGRRVLVIREGLLALLDAGRPT
jgi:excisionase family DNA binding protein